MTFVILKVPLSNVRVKSYVDVPADEVHLLSAVASVPVSVIMKTIMIMKKKE